MLAWVSIFWLDSKKHSLSKKTKHSIFSLERQIRRLSPLSSKSVRPRCSLHFSGGAIEAFESRHHHLTGVGCLAFSMGSSFGFSEAFSGELLSCFLLLRWGFFVFVHFFFICFFFCFGVVLLCSIDFFLHRDIVLFSGFVLLLLFSGLVLLLLFQFRSVCFCCPGLFCYRSNFDTFCFCFLVCLSVAFPAISSTFSFCHFCCVFSSLRWCWVVCFSVVDDLGGVVSLLHSGGCFCLGGDGEGMLWWSLQWMLLWWRGGLVKGVFPSWFWHSFCFGEFGVGFGQLVWWIWLCGVVMRWCCRGEVWREWGDTVSLRLMSCVCSFPWYLALW
jgi:hypothetical protein